MPRLMVKKCINRASLYLLLGLLILLACRQENREVRRDYIAAIEEWRQQRIERLMADQSWLTLAGLFWLHAGENRLGSGANNDVQFPAEQSPPFIGTIYVDGEDLLFKAAAGVEVMSNGEPIPRLELHSDSSAEPTVMDFGTLRWIVIKRGDRYGVRLWNRESANRRNFRGIDCYPIDFNWRIVAFFKPYHPAKKLAISTVIGTIDEQISPGVLIFTRNNRNFSLDVIAEPGDEQLFVTFTDRTSGKETYGGGRYMLVDRPDSTGYTIIDFNKAYNPPCAFSPYATCPIPPPQNRLSISVYAGERYTPVNSANH